MLGELHVQDQTCGQIGLRELDVFGGRSERDDIQMRGAEEIVQCFAHAEVIIDDKHDVILRTHGESLAEIGSVKLNVVPRGLLFVAQSRPLWASTIQRQIARPIPMPSSLVVKNGSNTCSTSLSPLP